MKEFDKNNFTYILNANPTDILRMIFVSPSVAINMNVLLACVGCLQNALSIGLFNSTPPHAFVA
jgi:hypothetical protein